METTGFDTSAFDRGTAPVLRLLSVDQAERLASYQGDDFLQTRLEELAEKCNEGQLTPDERAEYEGYIRANKFIALLQVQARKRLVGTPPNS